MMRQLQAFFLVSTLVLMSSAAFAQIAIVGATIIDGNGGAPIEDGVVLIEGNRILAVGGKSTAVPSRAKRIAARGKYVIPGLMDANVHLMLDLSALTLVRYEGRYDELAIEAAQVALRNGVTTVFDTWGPRAYLVKARDSVNEGRATASRIFLAGNIVGLDGPFSEDFFPQGKETLFEDFTDGINALWQENVGRELGWMAPGEVQQEIRLYAHRNIDFLHYSVTAHRREGLNFIQFSPRVQQVLVEEAHRAGLPVQARTTSGESLYLAVQAGVDLLQYCDVTVAQPIPRETVALIAERRIPCAIFPNTTKALAWYSENAPTPYLKRYYEVAELNQQALLRAGAVFVLATDGGIYSADALKWPWMKNRYPPEENLAVLGEGHFHWLLAVEQKGMKPMDALLAATRNTARAYQVDKLLGTLEKGKIADLLILDKNPLESAANYRSISLVMKEGTIIDRDSLPTQRLLTVGELPPAQRRSDHASTGKSSQPNGTP